MNTQIIRWGSRAACAALVGASLSGCGFTDPISSNPNAVPDAAVDQLFTSVQVTTFMWAGGNMSRLASVWSQQMDGTDRQFAGLADYNNIDESLLNNEWQQIYGQGGLEDIKKALVRAAARDDRIYAGILKIHEAFQIGMAASVWGDVPLSTAGEQEPTLDEQMTVYDRMIALLDEAIADLSTGQGTGPGAADFNFGGDPSPWIDIAHSLKARFHMHTAEVRGASAYQAALAAAQQGISSSVDTWYQIHSPRSQENNLWFQFMRDRSGYISAGAYGVDWLQDRGDPRLSLYYVKGLGPFEDVYIGSPPGNPPGDPQTNASNLNIPGEPDYDLAIVSCQETQFIIAEAQFALGNEAAAIAAANDGIACSAAEWGVTLDDMPGGLSGSALLAEIMEQKYSSIFLNIETWNDYKRTCLPALVPPEGESELPPRLVYPGNERQTNSNVPDVSDQPLRNDNDPNPC